MGSPVRSKKMVAFGPAAATACPLDRRCGKWSASVMGNRAFPLNRRRLVAGLGTSVLTLPFPALSAVSSQPRLVQAKPGVLALRPGGPPTPVWSLLGADLRFKRGDGQGISFQNDLPMPFVLDWRGIDGASAAEPLLGRPPLAPGGTDTFDIPIRCAGTFLCNLGLLADRAALPVRGLPVIVDETEAPEVDRDEVMLIEDWRLRPDGTPVRPGTDPTGTAPMLYTVNGLTALELTVRANARLRFRFINSSQRNVVAIKIENHEVRVMAMDSQPAEPFTARNGALVMAPGTRVDAFVDATAPPGSSSPILLHDGNQAHLVARLVTSKEPPLRNRPLGPALPLPSNGLPGQLALKNASRFEVTLGTNTAGWMAPAAFVTTGPPAFRAKAGRTVVLTLTNRGVLPEIYHLHGHHFRLLDRLDDGWKPFWLDTLAIEAGQTERIAFAAEYPGRWLMETMATDSAAPRLVHWYSIG